MKLRTLLGFGLSVAVTAFTFAQTSQTPQAINPQAAADVEIIQLLNQLHVDLLSGQNKDAQLDAQQWQNYQQFQDSLLMPKGNNQLLIDTIAYPSFSNDYVLRSLAPVDTSDKSLMSIGREYVCNSVDALKLPQCHAGKATFSIYDSNSLMPFAGQGLQDFSYTSDYVDSLVSSVNSSTKGGARGALSQLTSASIAYRVLNSIGKQYDTTDGGMVGPGGKASQMQILQKTVQAPLTKDYLNRLSQASTPQTTRALAEIAAESNVMKYKQIKQGQSVQVLLSALLVQQLRTNALLEKNLAIMKKLEKRHKSL